MNVVENCFSMQLLHSKNSLCSNNLYNEVLFNAIAAVDIGFRSLFDFVSATPADVPKHTVLIVLMGKIQPGHCHCCQRDYCRAFRVIFNETVSSFHTNSTPSEVTAMTFLKRHPS